MQQDRSGILILNESSEGTVACPTEPCKFFQAVEYRRQPRLQERALSAGLASGTSKTIERVSQVVSFLSSIGETSYLDLVRVREV